MKAKARKPPKADPDPVTAYARDIVDGRILAGRMVRLAAQRHLDDREHGHERGLEWHPERAKHALDFFEQFLVLPDGPHAGEPFKLVSWALFTVGSLHGWFTREGTRRFQFAFVLTGKGNAKTPVGCGLAVYAMTADEMQGAQCFVAARARVQAADSFKDVSRIIGPALRQRLEPLEHAVLDEASGSFVRPVSSEARTLEGGRVYFALLDEVALHKNAEIVKAMQRGTKGHTEAIIFAITNAGEDRESIAWELQEKSLKVLEGTLVDDEFFCYVCQLDPCAECAEAGFREPQDGCEACDSWLDEKVWPKTSPLLGITIPYSYLRKEVKGALDIPSTEPSVRRFNFCAWLRSEARWFTADQWAACGGEPVDLRGRPAILGIDLATSRDLAAAVLIAPGPGYFADITVDAETGVVKVGEVRGSLDVLCWTWCPEVKVLEQTRKGLPYDHWVQTGDLIATSGNVIDHRAIREHIVGLRTAGYIIQEIAYDPVPATQFAQMLQDEHGFTLTPIAQDYRTMTEPCILLETLVMQRRLRHGHSPVLRFAASNVILEQDSGGRRRPSKKLSEPNGKIDPISALVTGLKRVHMLQGMGVRAEVILGPPRTSSQYPTI